MGVAPAMPVHVEYIYEYPICALLFLVIVLVRYFSKRQLPLIRNRMFSITVVVACFNVVFDMLSSFVIERPAAYPVAAGYAICEIFYMLQLFFPVMMILYMLSLTSNLKYRNMKKILLAESPCILAMLIVLTNPVSRALFYIDNGVFYRGELFPLMYVVCIYSSLFCVFYALVARKRLQDKYFLTISAFAILTCGSLALQTWRPQLLVTSLAISVAVLLAYFVLQKPEDMVDHLTGLLNLEAMTAHINELIERDVKYSVVILKVENVRRINNIFGYTIGSLTLQNVSDFLATFSPDLRERNRLDKKANIYNHSKENVPGDARRLETALPSAWAFRLLSNQFAIVSTNSETHDFLVNYIHKRFEDPWYIRGLEMNLMETMVEITETETFSSGEELYKVIEIMLPTVPKGDTVSMSEYTLAKIERRISIEDALADAISQNRLQVLFQPVYNVKNGKFSKAEALIRFEHETLGYVTPDEFIPIAEQRGLVAEIDSYVLRKTCEFMKTCQDEGIELETVSVNLSVTEMASTSFPKQACAIVDEYKLDHEKFEFEIMEMYVSNSLMLIEENLGLLTGMGFHIAMDNYGTSDTSLAHLTALPLSTVKIDQSMLVAAEKSPRDLVVLENVIDMFRKMEVQTVAEGAEKVNQTEMVIRASVDYIQGFYYARPMSVEEFTSFVKLNNSQERKKADVNNIIVVQD